MIINRKDFMNALKVAIVTAGKNDVRKYLNTVLIEVHRDKVVVVSTDGHRISWCTLELTTGVDEQVDLLTSRVDVERLIKVIQVNSRSSEQDLSIKIGDKSVTFEADDSQFRLDRVEGLFPQWRRVVQVSENLDPLRPGLTKYVMQSQYLADAQKALKSVAGKTKDIVGVSLEFVTPMDVITIKPVKLLTCGQLTDVKLAIMPMRG